MACRFSTKRSLKLAGACHLLAGLSDETILMAKSKGETVKRQLSAFLRTHQHVKPILTGADFKAMGFKLGLQFKRFLVKLLHAKLNGEVKTEQDERRLVERMIP